MTFEKVLSLIGAQFGRNNSEIKITFDSAIPGKDHCSNTYAASMKFKVL